MSTPHPTGASSPRGYGGGGDDHYDHCPLCGTTLDKKLNSHLPECPKRTEVPA